MIRTGNPIALEKRVTMLERRLAGGLVPPLRKAFDKKSALRYSFDVV
jgi:hypothetical protein